MNFGLKEKTNVKLMYQRLIQVCLDVKTGDLCVMDDMSKQFFIYLFEKDEREVLEGLMDQVIEVIKKERQDKNYGKFTYFKPRSYPPRQSKFSFAILKKKYFMCKD